MLTGQMDILTISQCHRISWQHCSMAQQHDYVLATRESSTQTQMNMDLSFPCYHFCSKILYDVNTCSIDLKTESFAVSMVVPKWCRVAIVTVLCRPKAYDDNDESVLSHYSHTYLLPMPSPPLFPQFSLFPFFAPPFELPPNAGWIDANVLSSDSPSRVLDRRRHAERSQPAAFLRSRHRTWFTRMLSTTDEANMLLSSSSTTYIAWWHSRD